MGVLHYLRIFYALIDVEPSVSINHFWVNLKDSGSYLGNVGILS